MIRPLILLFVLVTSLTARAADLWPFAQVNNKIDISINGGYHLDYDVALIGFGITVRGFHLTVGGVGSSNRSNGTDAASAMLQVGYQIPIIKSFRVIPVVGFAAAGEVTFDMKYHFDGGLHLIYNHRKLIVNAAVTRYTLFGGIGVEF